MPATAGAISRPSISPCCRSRREASGNGTIYARNRQLALGTTFVASNQSLLEIRFGWSNTEAGKNPPALGTTSALDAFGLAGLPSDSRIAGGLPTQLVSGYADLGRQATNPQWQYPTVWNPKINYTQLVGRQSLKAGYEFQRINVEVMDVNPLYGRDAYTGQFSRPGGRRRPTTCTTSRTSCSACARSTR